jgi:hypothetical protein
LKPPTRIYQFNGKLKRYLLLEGVVSRVSRTSQVTLRWWLKPVILATQEDQGSKPTLGKLFVRPYLEKTYDKEVLVEWLRVKALSSNSSTAKNKNYSSVGGGVAQVVEGLPKSPRP